MGKKTLKDPDKCKHKNVTGNHCDDCALYQGPYHVPGHDGPYCDTCQAPVSVGHETWWSAVPGVGNQCDACHKTWMNDRTRSG